MRLDIDQDFSFQPSEIPLAEGGITRTVQSGALAETFGRREIKPVLFARKIFRIDKAPDLVFPAADDLEAIPFPRNERGFGKEPFSPRAERADPYPEMILHVAGKEVFRLTVQVTLRIIAAIERAFHAG